MASTINGLTVSLVIYKKIVEGDLSKFSASSNNAPGGGGARDLRFNPANMFFPVFNRMFPKTGDILSGFFSWSNYSNTKVEIYPPTESRSNELRITKIHECFPKSVRPNDATDCILLIVLDSSGKVWPYFTSQHSLIYDCWHPAIKDPILEGLNAQRSTKTSAMGYIDIDNGGSYTNGRI